MNENKTNETKAIASKKKKYSYTAMTSTALIIVAILILNAVVAVLGNKINLKMDFTGDSILAFSDTTNEIIDGLDMDVKIISLIPQSDTNREMIQLDEVLKKYDLASDKITYQRVDTKKNPGILNRYSVNGKALDGDHYIIFESSRMSEVVSVDDLFIVYGNIKDVARSGALQAEQYFSSAIVKVTEGSEVKVAVSKGHGEKFTAENFSKIIYANTSYEFEDVSLLNENIPEDAQVLIVASPQTDYSQEEILKIDEFARRGGDIQIIGDPDTAELPNLFKYMDEWGVYFENGVAADEDAGNYSKNKISIIGQISQNDITKAMGVNDQLTLFPLARPIGTRERVNTTVDILATTGKNGYVKQNINFIDESFKKGDIRAQSNLAVVATRQYSVEVKSKMFVLGTSRFIGSGDGDFTILSSTANGRFLKGLMDYMTDQPSSFYIFPKNTAQHDVVINQMSIYIYTMITVVLIPLAIIAWGIIIWIRRRHS